MKIPLKSKQASFFTLIDGIWLMVAIFLSIFFMILFGNHMVSVFVSIVFIMHGYHFLEFNFALSKMWKSMSSDMEELVQKMKRVKTEVSIKYTMVVFGEQIEFERGKYPILKKRTKYCFYVIPRDQHGVPIDVEDVEVRNFNDIDAEERPGEGTKNRLQLKVKFEGQEKWNKTKVPVTEIVASEFSTKHLRNIIRVNFEGVKHGRFSLTVSVGHELEGTPVNGFPWTLSFFGSLDPTKTIVRCDWEMRGGSGGEDTGENSKVLKVSRCYNCWILPKDIYGNVVSLDLIDLEDEDILEVTLRHKKKKKKKKRKKKNVSLKIESDYSYMAGIEGWIKVSFRVRKVGGYRLNIVCDGGESVLDGFPRKIQFSSDLAIQRMKFIVLSHPGLIVKTGNCIMFQLYVRDKYNNETSAPLTLNEEDSPLRVLGLPEDKDKKVRRKYSSLPISAEILKGHASYSKYIVCVTFSKRGVIRLMLVSQTTETEKEEMDVFLYQDVFCCYDEQSYPSLSTKLGLMQNGEDVEFPYPSLVNVQEKSTSSAPEKRSKTTAPVFNKRLVRISKGRLLVIKKNRLFSNTTIEDLALNEVVCLSSSSRIPKGELTFGAEHIDRRYNLRLGSALDAQNLYSIITVSRSVSCKIGQLMAMFPAKQKVGAEPYETIVKRSRITQITVLRSFKDLINLYKATVAMQDEFAEVLEDEIAREDVNLEFLAFLQRQTLDFGMGLVPLRRICKTPEILAKILKFYNAIGALKLANIRQFGVSSMVEILSFHAEYKQGSKKAETHIIPNGILLDYVLVLLELFSDFKDLLFARMLGWLNKNVGFEASLAKRIEKLTKKERKAMECVKNVNIVGKTTWLIGWKKKDTKSRIKKLEKYRKNLLSLRNDIRVKICRYVFSKTKLKSIKEKLDSFKRTCNRILNETRRMKDLLKFLTNFSKKFHTKEFQKQGFYINKDSRERFEKLESTLREVLAELRENPLFNMQGYQDFARACVKQMEQNLGKILAYKKDIAIDDLEDQMNSSSFYISQSSADELFEKCGVPIVPVTRICVFCLASVTREREACKHTTCTSCNRQFCQLCLRGKIGMWRCGGAYSRCDPNLVPQAARTSRKYPFLFPLQTPENSKFWYVGESGDYSSSGMPNCNERGKLQETISQYRTLVKKITKIKDSKLNIFDEDEDNEDDNNDDASSSTADESGSNILGSSQRERGPPGEDDDHAGEDRGSDNEDEDDFSELENESNNRFVDVDSDDELFAF